MAGKNILIVDDDSRAVNAMVEALESEGYAVFASSTKKSAVDLSQRVKPSLIYVNAILTDASGLEITRAIRTVEAMKSVPIVMLTEMEEEFSERYRATYGIVGYLKKPVEGKELLQKTASYVPLDEMPSESSGEFDLRSSPVPESAGGMEFGEVNVPELPEKEKQGHEEYGHVDLGGPESTAEPEPPQDIKKAHKTPEEPKQETFGSPREVAVVKKEEKPQETSESMPALKKPKIPGKQPVEKVEVDENFNPDKLFRDAKRTAAGAKGNSFASGLKNKATRGISKKNLVRNGLIAGIALSSVPVILYLWFFADFGIKKEAGTQPKPSASIKELEKDPQEAVDQGKHSGTTAPLSLQPEAEQATAGKTSDTTGSPVVNKTPEKSVQHSAPLSPKPLSPEKGKAARPAEGKPPAPGPGYYVQVGFFSVEENAENLSAELKSKNYIVFIRKDKTRNGIRYRVLVGKYKTRAEAQKAMKKISSALNIQGAVYRI